MTTNCKSGRRRNALLFGICVCLFAALARAQQPVQASETTRLIQTAHLWIAVKYFHPYLAYKPIDWDRALIDALPKIRAAKTSNEYASALQLMLDVLHDPGTQAYVEPNKIDTALMRNVTGLRIWVHNGFPPESGQNNGPFYSAFTSTSRNGSPASVNLSLGRDVGVVMTVAEGLLEGSQPIPSVKPDSYPAATYPSPEYRILAAFKMWGVIHHFYAYRDLMDEDWDDVFASFLPRFIAAKDAREYNLLVSEMMTHTLDSNVSVSSHELNQYFGMAAVGLRLRIIEQKPVITQILDSKANEAGIRVGDIVSRVDGEAIAQRFNRIQDCIGGGTPQRRGYDSLQLVLNGVEGSTAKLMIGSRDGPAKEIQLQRTTDFAKHATIVRNGDPIRMLAGNIGYADLTHLPDDQLSGIFEKLQSAAGIIFDARGPVSTAARSIAEHLTSANDVAGAIINGPIAFSPDVPTARSLTSTASYFVVERVPPEGSPKYTGKTVMLIDERTIGAAEHLGLWLEAANNTAFIGTPSAGADGETSNFVLPGDIVVTFSGQDVRHGNSGKLQRLGLQPTVVAAPSIDGIRKGRDEVLEKAIEYLTSDGHTNRAGPALSVLSW